MTLFFRQPLFDTLRQRGLDEWAATLERLCEQRLDRAAHGTMGTWIEAWQKLPDVAGSAVEVVGNAVCVTGSASPSHESLRAALMDFHPWRKGPFDLFGLRIDAEWQSNLKWDRLVGRIQFAEKRVLDVGCGNGYYGWRMLDAGAHSVLGCDPYLLYLMQFEAIRKYAAETERHVVVPVGDAELPGQQADFDIALSMGVLYHRTSPIDHLLAMKRALRPGGQLVLETLIIESDQAEVLMPERRYAKMRNVWFIPSLPMLRLWLRRSGFMEPEVVSVDATTPREQRRTEWMMFESLSDFLDPDDPSRTCEGYPAPLRALVTARQPG